MRAWPGRQVPRRTHRTLSIIPTRRRTVARIVADRVRAAALRTVLHLQRLRLRLMVAAADYDAVWHAQEAGRCAPECVALRLHLERQAAFDRDVAARLRVRLAQVEAGLWPVRR